jgi:hypothetical protein
MDQGFTSAAFWKATVWPAIGVVTLRQSYVIGSTPARNRSGLSPREKRHGAVFAGGMP